jgi:hypothetical protein
MKKGTSKPKRRRWTIKRIPRKRRLKWIGIVLSRDTLPAPGDDEIHRLFIRCLLLADGVKKAAKAAAQLLPRDGRLADWLHSVLTQGSFDNDSRHETSSLLAALVMGLPTAQARASTVQSALRRAERQIAGGEADRKPAHILSRTNKRQRGLLALLRSALDDMKEVLAFLGVNLGPDFESSEPVQAEALELMDQMGERCAEAYLLATVLGKEIRRLERLIQKTPSPQALGV